MSSKKQEKSLRQMKTKDVAALVSEEFRIAVTIALERFRLSESETELAYPSSLTATERAYIHHLSQPLGLKSKSKGKDPNRILTVTKKNKKERAAAITSFTFERNSRSAITTLIQKHPVNQRERQELQPRTERAQLHGPEIVRKSVSKNVVGRLISNSPLTPPPRSSDKYSDFTSTLPVNQLKDDIVAAIGNSRVVMVTGETGSGKTTQVPQMILDDCFQKQKPCRILCTQPRRLAAMTVADRVAAERGEHVGETVGFTVRLDNKYSEKTILMFCTTGVMLRTLTSSDQSLEDVTHIVVDEIHERDRFTDFLLTVLRDQMSRFRHLKLILMSAAINTQLFVQYFSGCSLISAPGRLFDVKEYFLEDVLQLTNYKSEAMRKYESAQLPNASKKKLAEWCEEVGRQASSTEVTQHASAASDVRHIDEKPDNEEFDEEDGEIYIEDEKVGKDKEELEENIKNRMDELLEKIFRTGDELLFNEIYHLMATESVSVDYEHSQTLATPLMLAAGRGFLSQVEQLVMLGANILHRSAGNGWTALDWAQHFEHHEVMEMLQSYLAVTENVVDASYQLTSAPTSAPAMPKLSEEQSQALVTYQATIDEEKVDTVLVSELLCYLLEQTSSGAILVFLPGYDDIIAVKDQLNEEKVFSNGNKFVVYLLHSSLQSSDQRKVFTTPPNGTRKIILSTNIAETSITIDDVVFVIDCGKVKEKTFDALTSVHTLKAQWISKASALQRKGRAGRCQEGICYRLYSQRRFQSFQHYQTPEILRHPLPELCLQTKLLAPANTAIADFLNKAPEPPAFLIVRNAVHLLKQIDALDTFEDLTDLGHHLSDLPIEPRYGKMILYGVMLKCLDPVLTIAASMSFRDPFVLPLVPYLKRQASMVRRQFSSGAYSDHMSVLRAYQGWRQACRERREREYCLQNFLSCATMEMIHGIRGQLLSQLRVSGFIKRRGPGDISDLNMNSENWAVIKAALVAGLYPSVVQINRKKRKLLSHKEGNLHFHMNSVLGPEPDQLGNKAKRQAIDNLPTDWLVFEEMSRTHRLALIKGCTMVTSLTLALFAGPACLAYETWGDDEERRRLKKQTSDQSGVGSESEEDEGEHDPNFTKLVLDDWLQFLVDKQTAQLARNLRQKCQAMLLHRVQKPYKSWSKNDEQVLQTVVNVLTEEEKAQGLEQPRGIGQHLHSSLEGSVSSGSGHISRDESSDEVLTSSTSPSSGLRLQVTSQDEELSEKLAGSLALTESSSASSSPTDEDRPGDIGPLYPNRYFVMKCQSYKCLDMSIQRKQWSTHPLNEKKLTTALQEGSNVYLVFSVQGSSHFQGVAKMAGRPGSEKIKEFGTGHTFPVTWLKRANLPFSQCHHLINSWNDNKRVQVSRDGQELEPTVGEMLVQLWEKVAPLQYHQHSRGGPPRHELWGSPPQIYSPAPAPPQMMNPYYGGAAYTLPQPPTMMYGPTYHPQHAGRFQGQGGFMQGYYPSPPPQGAYGPRHNFYRQ